MIKNVLPILVLITIISGCAIQQPIVNEQTKVAITVPSGIDTLTTLTADSIFALFAIDEKDEEVAKILFNEAQELDGLADSLWKAGKDGLLTRLDTLTVLAQIARAEKYLLQDKEAYKPIKRLMKKSGKLNSNVLSSISKQLMLQGISVFENAIKQNRFNIANRQAFSKFLEKLAERFQDRNYLFRAADELERVVFVIKEYYQLYYDLGEIYFKLGDWNNAFKNYELAKTVFKKTAIFAIPNPQFYFNCLDEVPVDTNRLVNYLQKQAICKTKLYEAQPALALYREARAITPIPEYKELFERQIKWILWDEGNIRAAEIKDSGDTLRWVTKNYLAAKQVYLDLLPMLWTKRTRDEINWYIAQLDYGDLGNKAEGVSRMYYVIKNSAVDSLTGMPIDSTYQRYFNTYGKMCFNLGNEHYQTDKLTAYIYFNQAAVTNYNERGKAYLRLAQISEFDPNETIELCKIAMAHLNELDNNEKLILYEVLYKTYRKLGDFKSAKQWYDSYKSF